MRRCYRAWVRHQGQIIRLICTHDYQPCATGGEPRNFTKRITHKRWPKGFHLSGCEWSRAITAHYASLPADQWVEEVYEVREVDWDHGFNGHLTKN
jgi:hypothetical protein